MSEQLILMHQVVYFDSAIKHTFICGAAAVPLRQRLQLAGSSAAASPSGPGFLPAVAEGLTGFIQEPVRSDYSCCVCTAIPRRLQQFSHACGCGICALCVDMRWICAEATAKVAGFG